MTSEMQAVPVLSIMALPTPWIEAARYIIFRQFPLPRKAMGMEPIAVTTTEIAIGITLLRNRYVSQFCRVSEKMSEQI